MLQHNLLCTKSETNRKSFKCGCDSPEIDSVTIRCLLFLTIISFLPSGKMIVLKGTSSHWLSQSQYKESLPESPAGCLIERPIMNLSAVAEELTTFRRQINLCFAIQIIIIM